MQSETNNQPTYFADVAGANPGARGREMPGGRTRNGVIDDAFVPVPAKEGPGTKGHDWPY